MIEIRTAFAHSRRAGQKVLHTVIDYDGFVAGQRRSERRYDYAICERVNRDGEAHVRVNRWSGSMKCKRSEFPIKVNHYTEL